MAGPDPNDPTDSAVMALYEQLVAKRAESLMGLFDDPDFARVESAAFSAVAARVNTMGADDREVLAAVIRRAAADTLINMLGLITGSYAIDGFDGDWTLARDGEDVGGRVLEIVLDREVDEA